MKKLSLEMLRFTSDEVLQRSQMKKITGGYGPGGGAGSKCNVTCLNPSTGNSQQFGPFWTCNVGCPQGMGLVMTQCVCT